MGHRPRALARRPMLVVGLAGIAAIAATGAANAASTHATAGDTLVVDKSFDLKTADPQRQYEPTGGIVDLALYDSLLRFKGGDVSKPLPHVASSYTASKDARTYTFLLRKDVQLSDGTPLASADGPVIFRRPARFK